MIDEMKIPAHLRGLEKGFWLAEMVLKDGWDAVGDSMVSYKAEMTTLRNGNDALLLVRIDNKHPGSHFGFIGLLKFFSELEVGDIFAVTEFLSAGGRRLGRELFDEMEEKEIIRPVGVTSIERHACWKLSKHPLEELRLCAQEERTNICARETEVGR